MPASEQNSHRLYANRKPTVRIVKPESAYRAPIIILIAVALLAFLAVAFWRIFLPAEITAVEQRDIRDIVMDWRCDNGHYFEANGVSNAIPCDKCGRDSYPVETHYCPDHGRFPVSVRFDQLSKDLRVEARRITDGDWTPANEALICPRCTKPLHKKRRDPLAQSVRNKRKLDESRAGRRN